MSNTKFTPGPWIHNTDFHLYKKDNYSEIIAGIGYFDIEGEQHGFNIAGLMTDADAKLIAAAPTMLEALQECEEYFDNKADADHDESGFVINNEMRFLLLVKKAIKKATE